MARLQYLYKVIQEFASVAEKSCPYCRGVDLELIGTKWVVLQLLRCRECKLMFRYPKDNTKTNLAFYEEQYYETGITSDIPNDQLLEQYLSTSFLNTEKDFSEKIQIIKRFSNEGKILDYGCSWGYGTWQFKKVGFDAVGFEISKTRADFGRKKLGLSILDEAADLKQLKNKSFDVIFTNHALEHLPNLFGVFDTFYNLLNANGYLMIFVPNCIGVDNKKVFNSKKSYAFGEKHSLAFDRYFFEINLPKHGFEVQCTSSPYEINDLFSRKENPYNAEYSELFVLGKK